MPVCVLPLHDCEIKRFVLIKDGAHSIYLAIYEVTVYVYITLVYCRTVMMVYSPSMFL